MKRQLKSYSLFTLALIVLLASCSKKAKIPVPVDAAFVMHISGSSLDSKLSWEEFKKGELFKTAYEQADDEYIKSLLDNPDKTGIDIKSDAYLFVTTRGRGGYVGFTCGLKDAAAFTDLINKKLGASEISKEGDMSVIKEGSKILTWDSKRLVAIFDSPDINSGGGFNLGNNSYGSRSFSEDSLIKFASEIYDLKGSKSIGSISKFASVMDEPGDMHFWFNPGKFYGASMSSLLSLTKASILFDGNFTSATLNFENGKIKVDGKTFYNKELWDFYQKNKPGNLDADALKKIPSDNIVAALAVNYPPEGLKGLLSLLGVDGLVNAFLSGMGFSIEDFVKANKGDVMLAVTDFVLPARKIPSETEYFTPSPKPEAKILFATSVKDKESFQKLISILEGQIKKEDGKLQEMASTIPYQLKDDWFVAGNDSAMVNAFGSTTHNPDFISKISGHPFGLYINLQKFMTGSRPSLENDPEALSILDESLKTWQDMVFYGGEYSNDAGESHYEINMVDKNTNSLKQLNDYLGVIARKTAEKRNAWKKDNLLITPVPDSVVVPKSK